MEAQWFVIGLDNGGTKNNATVLTPEGEFLVKEMIELPSRVKEGSDVAVQALVLSFNDILERTGIRKDQIRAVGLDSPGPASADGVISSRGSTNFAHESWHSFDFRGVLEAALGVPVIYNNDGNAAALYAHYQHFGEEGNQKSSISAIVGTGLGGGVIVNGQIIQGGSGYAGELGHVHIPMEGLLEKNQPRPECNCGFTGDVESVASLTAIKTNLLPYWLTQYPDHDLNKIEDIGQAAKMTRSYGEKGDEMARKIFQQQAMAIGRLFTIASRFTDPDAYFVGGGIAESTPDFRNWFLDTVKAHSLLEAEQLARTSMHIVSDLDMAGARGAAIAAMEIVKKGVAPTAISAT